MVIWNDKRRQGQKRQTKMMFSLCHLNGKEKKISRGVEKKWGTHKIQVSLTLKKAVSFQFCTMASKLNATHKAQGPSGVRITNVSRSRQEFASRWEEGVNSGEASELKTRVLTSVEAMVRGWAGGGSLVYDTNHNMVTRLQILPRGPKTPACVQEGLLHLFLRPNCRHNFCCRQEMPNRIPRK